MGDRRIEPKELKKIIFVEFYAKFFIYFDNNLCLLNRDYFFIKYFIQHLEILYAD